MTAALIIAGLALVVIGHSAMVHGVSRTSFGVTVSGAFLFMVGGGVVLGGVARWLM